MAQAEIEDYRGVADCDGWSEDVESVCWGVILQCAKETDGQDVIEEADFPDCVTPRYDYELAPALAGSITLNIKDAE